MVAPLDLCGYPLVAPQRVRSSGNALFPPSPISLPYGRRYPRHHQTFPRDRRNREIFKIMALVPHADVTRTRQLMRKGFATDNEHVIGLY